MKNVIFLAILATLLTACGHKQYDSLGKFTLLGEIEETGRNEYRLASLGNKTGNINLNKVEYNGSTYNRKVTGFDDLFFKAGVVYKTTNGYTTSEVLSIFDSSKFYDAAEKVLLNVDRKKLTETLDSFLDSYQRKMESVNPEIIKHNNNLEQVNINYNIIDKSGLYKNGELKLGKLVKIKHIEPMKPFKFTVRPSDFYSFIDSERNKINNTESLPTSLTNEFDVIDCIKDTLMHGNYVLSCNMPNDVKTFKYTGAGQVVTADITIHSINYGVVPINYTNSDNNIAIKTDGKIITVSNLTDKYISIVSTSVYYGNERATPVNTFNWEKAGVKYNELPPKSIKEIPVSDFFDGHEYIKYLKDSFEFNRMTIDKAKNRNFVFGLAVKYSTGNRSVEESLYKANTYNAYKLIMENL